MVLMVQFHQKRFDSFDEFEKAASQPNSKVNKTIVENLRAIGAFASIEPSEPSAKDLSRRKDQMRLLPGLIIDSVKQIDTQIPQSHSCELRWSSICAIASNVTVATLLDRFILIFVWVKDAIYGCFGLSNLGGRKERKTTRRRICSICQSCN